MAEEYEQFYRTWCYSGRSVSGADGWKVRGKSEGLALQEAEGLADLANYWSPTEYQRETPPGRRLALFRRQEDSVVAHGAPVTGLVGGRGGVSFEHVLVGLPVGISALDVVRLWRSSVWRVEDGNFSEKLDRFTWDEGACGPECQSPGAAAARRAGRGRDGTVSLELLNQTDVMQWASYVLRACLAATGGAVDKVFVAGKDDVIVRLLFVAFYCLPERLRSKMTFSTHENPKATKGVQIVGVTTFEGGEPDLPGFCYDGRYCALNTFSGRKSEDLRASVYAESAIQWILCGQHGLLAQVRARFDALDPADNPGVGELDLLAEHPPVEDGEPAGAEGLLKLCGSAAIGRSKIRDRKEFGLLLTRAKEDGGFGNALVAQLGTWLPKHEAASGEWPRELAEAAFGRLREGLAFEELAWLGEFAGRLGHDFELRYWDELIVKCREGSRDAASAEAGMPALETRLRLLATWRQWHQLAEDGGGGAFDGLVGCWLRVQPQELGTVLNSDLGEDLKREAVRLWLRSGIAEEFRKVIGEARKSGEFREQVVAQLAGLAGQQSDALRRFPLELAGLGLVDLRGGGGFAEVEWLGRLAGGVGHSMEGRFWEELLVVCQGSASRVGSGDSFLPSIETRISLFEKWEKATWGREQTLAGVLAGGWLRVTPQELVRVLRSGMSAGLKVESLKLCLGRAIGIDAREGEAVFDLICKDAEVTRATFFEMPGWQGGAVVGRVPEACFSMLLACQAEQMRLANFLDEGVVETVGFWNARVPKAVPARMRALLSFGEYARNPGGFRQATGLAPELMRPEFWAREQDRDAAVNGAVDRLLSRGDLSDFERALDWFGEKKWAASGAELVQLAHRRLVGVPVACRDASLQRMLVFFGAVLKEWKEDQTGAAVEASVGESVVGDVKTEEYEVLGRVAMRHLPGSSLLKSPTGRLAISILHNQNHLLGAILKEWVQKLRSLIEVRELIGSGTELKREEIRDLISSLAEAYTAMERREDQEVRDWIHDILLQWVKQRPQTITAILSKFTCCVYATREQLFLECFIDPFRRGLADLEKQRSDGVVASEYVLWCCNEGESSFGGYPGLVDGWLTGFMTELSEKSRKRTDKHLRLVVKCSPETLKRWRKASGYSPGWFESQLGKRIVGSLFLVSLLGLVAVLGVESWDAYQERAFREQEPSARGKKLSVWIDQFRAEAGGTESGMVEAKGAIQEIGTNGIPALLRMAGKKDSAVGMVVGRVFHVTSEKEWHRRALHGFIALGSAGVPAAGDLNKMVAGKDARISECAGACLKVIRAAVQEGGRQ